MRLLVFQHIDCEHPGRLRDFLEEDGITWDAVELDEGEEIPDLSGYDALWVMGGPMDVWETESHPWLIQEKEAIRLWVADLKKPFLGICLGHQLLADALGGRCARWPLRTVVTSGNRRPRGRPHRGRTNGPDLCRNAEPSEMPAMARRGGGRAA